MSQDQSQNPTPMALTSQENAPSMLTFAYYQRYFDVDTPQVKERLVWSFIPRPSRDTLTHYIRPSPDLYGMATSSIAFVNLSRTMYIIFVFSRSAVDLCYSGLLRSYYGKYCRLFAFWRRRPTLEVRFPKR